MRPAAIVIALLLVAGCSNPRFQNEASEEAVASEPAAMEEAEEKPEVAEAAAEPGARPWSEEGLTEQPRMAELKEQTDPEMGTPESTEWRTSEREVPDSMTGSASPAELMGGLASEMGFQEALGTDVWEQTTRVLQEEDDRASGALLQWGFKDDSVAGADLLVRMSHDGRLWHVEELLERVHCRRGVTDGLCL